MYDDEDEFDEDEDGDEGEIGVDSLGNSFKEKGVSDRAYVDQQAKDYDEKKRKKREKLAHLKTLRLSAQSKLAAKQHELAQLEVHIRKDEYVETRERIADERKESTSAEGKRQNTAESEIAAISLGNDQEAREAKHRELMGECAALKQSVDQAAREISLLEHEIIRS